MPLRGGVATPETVTPWNIVHLQYTSQGTWTMINFEIKANAEISSQGRAIHAVNGTAAGKDF